MSDLDKTIELELRKAASAAYMAYYYGVSRNDILAAVEQGLAEAEELLDQRRRTDSLLASLRAA